MKSPQRSVLTELRFGQPICSELLRSRYLQPGERGVDDIAQRVARALASVEAQPVRSLWERRFLAALRSGFIPAGRIMANAGTSNDAGLINCFVQPIAPRLTGRDADGKPGIELALQESSRTMRMGGGVGFDLSHLPARGSSPGSDNRTRELDPVSVVLRLEANGRKLARIGARRAAQMALLDIDHPDIGDFIDLKRHRSLQTVTLSVRVTDDFMETIDSAPAPNRARSRASVCAGTSGRQARRSAIWRLLVDAAWDTGNPGLVFIDAVNRDNNLSDRERLDACNPCGEQFLPDYGACDLGSIDLTRLVRDPFQPKARIDFERLRQIVPIAVRALDNVIDLTRWPLPQQAHEAARTRRIGLGVTGLADALVMMGLRYDRKEGRAMAISMLRAIRNLAYQTSSDLAVERGSFPLFQVEPFLRSPHAASRLPAWLRKRIACRGLRNSHLLAIAPTGSISIAFAGNVSSGVEPAFAARSLRRASPGAEHPLPSVAEDFAWRIYRHRHSSGEQAPPAWCDTSTMHAIDHIRMLAALQPLVDSAIAKTVNLAEHETREGLDGLLRMAWRSGLKGITVFRVTGSSERVLCAIDASDSARTEIDQPDLPGLHRAPEPHRTRPH